MHLPQRDTDPPQASTEGRFHYSWMTAAHLAPEKSPAIRQMTLSVHKASPLAMTYLTDNGTALRTSYLKANTPRYESHPRFLEYRDRSRTRAHPAALTGCIRIPEEPTSVRAAAYQNRESIHEHLGMPSTPLAQRRVASGLQKHPRFERLCPQPLSPMTPLPAVVALAELAVAGG